MQTTAQDLFSQLLEFGESARLEAKRGTQISDSVMQTVCAFANEPGLEGGYLLLGVSEPDAQHDNYHVSGVTDVDQLLNELHNNCRSQFEQPVFIRAQAVMLKAVLTVKTSARPACGGVAAMGIMSVALPS